MAKQPQKPIRSAIPTFTDNAKKLIQTLGWSGLQPYSQLHGTTNKTWGRKNTSMWFVTFQTDANDKIESVEVNAAYFGYVKPMADKINKMLAKGVDIKKIFLTV